MGTVRLARTLLLLHVGFIGASILAFAFIVNRPPPPGVDPVLWHRAYDLGMAWTGPLYIVTGFGAALCGLASVAGWNRAMRTAAAIVVASLIVELVGTSTGFPFGPYGYGEQLGLKVLGRVPVVIPLSWFLMTYGSLAVATRVSRRPGVVIPIVALGLLAWDILMDPTFSAVFPFWAWHAGGVYYGMPLQNWVGWYLTGLVLALLAHRLLGAHQHALANTTLPLVIYTVNGVFPLALGIMAGLYGAAAVGGGAMAVFLLLPRLLTQRRAAGMTVRRV